MGIGDVIILVVLAIVIALAVHHIIKTKKSGGCTGNCANCSCGCSGSKNSAAAKK